MQTPNSQYFTDDLMKTESPMIKFYGRFMTVKLFLPSQEFFLFIS